MAGTVGAIVGTPADLMMVRMTLDGRLPAEQRRNYSGVTNALVRIVREEGVATLWRVSLSVSPLEDHIRCVLYRVVLRLYSDARSPMRYS